MRGCGGAGLMAMWVSCDVGQRGRAPRAKGPSQPGRTLRAGHVGQAAHLLGTHTAGCPTVRHGWQAADVAGGRAREAHTASM